MDTEDKLHIALKDAMRSGDKLRKQAIRLALSSIKLAEVNANKSLEDSEILGILQKEIKSRLETIESAKIADRNDLIEIANTEINILKEFLPEQLDEDDIVKLAKSAIEEVDAVSLGDMGKVMKNLLPKIQGRASNSEVSKIVRRLLNG